ncbi:hypothetical protein ATANTOWER_012166 [Ataeniobius toweri]|uniref:Uncharacterized protein n=1 Tax=Ataeniobius toweri TaxID=208326 RepID=A0ABU7AEQ0_9TELE|nr:hypothetical protein [Ataeniobius toweri]
MGTKQSPDDLDIVKDIKEPTAQDLNKRCVNDKESLYMASAVDPRFKNLYFLSETEVAEICRRLIEAVVAEIQKQNSRRTKSKIIKTINQRPTSSHH